MLIHSDIKLSEEYSVHYNLFYRILSLGYILYIQCKSFKGIFNLNLLITCLHKTKTKLDSILYQKDVSVMLKTWRVSD